MTHSLILAAAQSAPHVRHRVHGGIFGLLILVIIIAVVVFILVQRSRDRRPIAEGSPTTPLAVSNDHGEGGTATMTLTAIALKDPAPAGQYSLMDLARAEWTKLRSVRSTMWTLVVTVVLGLGVSAIATAETRSHWSSMSMASIQGFDPTSLSLIGVFIAEFAIGVLGVLVMSAEYTTGTIRAVFSAAPRRVHVLLAKILVFLTVAVIVAEFVSFSSFFLGQALLSSPAIHATLSTPGALRAVVGCGLFVATLGLLGLGLATIMRHSAAAISTFVGILLILPLIVTALPSSLAMDVRRFLPDRIGATIITTNNGFAGSHAFSPWVGLLILVGYAVAANVIGAVLLVRRDA